MSDSQRSGALAAALLRILRILARIGMRHGVSCQAFIDLAKRAHVDAALEDFALAGRKPSVSRAAVLTGLTRKDIQRLLAEKGGADTETSERYNRAARVVAGWVRDPAFCDVQHEPRVIPLDGGDTSFAALVRRYSGDMPARAVLDELIRVGTAERTAEGGVRLLSRVYIPATSDVDKLHTLGTDVAYLADTIDHNLQHGATDPRFQRKVLYDNLPEEAIPEFRRLSAANTQKLIEDLDRWLAQHDRDVNPSVRGTGRVRAGLGAFYFEQHVPQTPTDPKADNK